MRRFLLLVSFASVLQSGAQSWKAAPVSLTTQWGEKVTPENAWREYPRPQMKRDAWMNLNGLWDYAVQNRGEKAPAKFEGQILVPFCIESSLSGVGKPLLPSQELWYNKKFILPADWSGKEVILRFDAVDYETRLWVNGKKVGEHKGGSDPFSFNITPFLNKKAEQEIILSVWDPTDTDLQPRGKQALEPKGIWYTPVSGIWQTVWLEALNKTAIQKFDPVPDIDNGKVNFHTTAVGLTGKEKLQLRISSEGNVIKDTVLSFIENFSVSIPSARLWTPEHPHLYNVQVSLQSNGKLADTFASYFAMRKIALGEDGNGLQRLMLNNKPVFQYGTLDQGWWPDGLLTPPSDAAMLFDMIKLKDMGFNMIRKHIKVEPSRYYFHADTMGILLWQDMPSGFAGMNTPSHVAAEAKEDWVRPAASAQQFEKEWKAIMDHLRFFPSIVMWVPLNEGWGQYDTKRIAELTKQYDPTRLVDAPSGWTDRGVGDVYDAHQYPGPGMEPASGNKGRAIVLGEFGGLGLVVKNHIWDANKRNWGYKTYMENQVLISEYAQLMHNMKLMIPRGLAAAVYTQTTDVEGEVNGLMTYDRRVVKIPEDLLRILHAPLYEQAEGKVVFLNKKDETTKGSFRYVKTAPSSDWHQAKNTGSFHYTTDKVQLKKGESIYAYQDFDITNMPKGFGMKLYGFGDAKVYLNGKLIWQEDKIRTKRHYDDLNLTEYIRYLKPGNNRLSFECTNATQDTSVDFAIYAYEESKPVLETKNSLSGSQKLNKL